MGIVRLLFWILASVPLAVSSRFVRAASWVWWWVVPIRRNVAVEISVAFPPGARACFAEDLCRADGLCEFFKAMQGDAVGGSSAALISCWNAAKKGRVAWC